MKTRKNCFWCFVVIWLLALFAVSSANAYDDEVKVVSAGKQIVQVGPSPVIDDGEPGMDPRKFETVTYSAAGDVQEQNRGQNCIQSQELIAMQRDVLIKLLYYLTRQLVW